MPAVAATTLKTQHRCGSILFYSVEATVGAEIDISSAATMDLSLCDHWTWTDTKTWHFPITLKWIKLFDLTLNLCRRAGNTGQHSVLSPCLRLHPLCSVWFHLGFTSLRQMSHLIFTWKKKCNHPLIDKRWELLKELIYTVDICTSVTCIVVAS